MAVLHDFWNITDCFDEVGAEVARVRRGVANPLNPRNPGKQSQKIGERDIAFSKIFAVAVDGLAEQRHFFGAQLRQASNFFDNLFGWATPFASPGGWNDAERAELVASVLDGHECFEPARSFELALRDIGDNLALAFGKVESLLDRKSTPLKNTHNRPDRIPASA